VRLFFQKSIYLSVCLNKQLRQTFSRARADRVACTAAPSVFLLLAPPMRGPKASVGSQHGDIRQWMGSGDGTSGGAASSSAAPALRQADLTQLAGVVAWDGASALLEGIPPTLYLGEREVAQLKERLQDASSRECPDDHLVLLRRLSTMVTSAPPAHLPHRAADLFCCVC